MLRAVTAFCEGDLLDYATQGGVQKIEEHDGMYVHYEICHFSLSV